jgi:hypothetical protein
VALTLRRRGYEPTLEAAMATFAKSWRRRQKNICPGGEIFLPVRRRWSGRAHRNPETPLRAGASDQAVAKLTPRECLRGASRKAGRNGPAGCNVRRSASGSVAWGEPCRRAAEGPHGAGNVKKRAPQEFPSSPSFMPAAGGHIQLFRIKCCTATR